jgi:hypothetical protein
MAGQCSIVWSFVQYTEGERVLLEGGIIAMLPNKENRRMNYWILWYYVGVTSHISITRSETCILNGLCEVRMPIAMQKYSQYRPV